MCLLMLNGVVTRTPAGPVNWISQLQTTMTVSSMKAEYVAYFYAIQDFVFIYRLLTDIDLEGTRSTKVFIDNQLARQHALNPVHYQRPKHINIKNH